MMNLNVNGRIRRAIGLAFAAGVAGAGVMSPAQAQDTTSGGATKLEGVEVTGSRIRRVDSETSNLVQVLDKKQIEATGATSLGELIQSIPAVSGAPLTPASNNNGISATGGGGTFGGSSAIDIRGLGPKRTLVLLDGQRLNNTDPDAIPINMIERVEVLKEGAGSTYGTDAIGGVVNFITRKNFSGLEASAQYGKTDRGDGANYGANITWGATGARGNAIFGFHYDRQDEIRATDREATALPTNRTSPYAYASSRSPNGKFLGAGMACAETLKAGATDSSNLANFRCYNGSTTDPSVSDRFNYQPYNRDLDPTNHESIFGTGTYKVTDDIKWYAEGYYTHGYSQNALAPEPFDNGTIQGIYPTSPAPVISKDNIYNPFGVDITSFAKRATDAGGRLFNNDINQYQATTGLKGTLLDRFEWDAAFNYGALDSTATDTGLLNFSKVYQQIGPSWWQDPNTGKQVAAGAAGAVGVCGNGPGIGNVGTPIPSCTPVNVFGPGGNNLGSLEATTNDFTHSDESDLTLNISGDLFNLPAGPLGVAAGFQYRDLNFQFTPDALKQAFAASEANTKSTNGGYNVREFYAETHVPVLAELPGVKSLNLNLGVRYSSFSSFGNHTAGQYALEYKPYADLMLRATYSDTYRAPGVTELFGGAAQSAAAYSDPCLDQDPNSTTFGHATTASLAGKTSVCKGVQVGATQPNTQGNGNREGNTQLKPEHGYSTDFGIVFNPSFYKPVSFTLDYWHYSLKDGISGVQLQTILDDCAADNASAFCGNAPNGNPYFVRTNNGTTPANFSTAIVNAELPNLNSFSFYVTGWDGSIKLSYPKVQLAGYALGNFDLGVDVSYVDKFILTTLDPVTGSVVGSASDAGQFDTGNILPIPRFKGLAYLFWSMGPFGVTMEDRYTGNLHVDNPSYQTGPVSYFDMSGTYTLKKYSTAFTVGVNDLFDDGIQRTYDGDTAGGPLPIYDVRGRNFYGKIAVRFK